MRYVTNRNNLAFTVLMDGGLKTVAFENKAFETEDKSLIEAIGIHRLFGVAFHVEGQQEVAHGITVDAMEAIKARARATLAGEPETPPEPEPAPPEDAEVEIPSLDDLKGLRKQETYALMQKLGIEFSQRAHFQTNKKILREWIEANS